MGAPAQTYFCGNGHIIVDVPHHGFIYEIPYCPQCDNDKVYMTLEWQDPDYGDIDADVPHIPISYEHKVIEVDIPTYDISNLVKRQGDNGIGRDTYV